MGRIVQARLDDRTERILSVLRRRTGLTDSEILRRALLEMSAMHRAGAGKRVIGLGRFRSGCRDLATNRKHMTGFGES